MVAIVTPSPEIKQTVDTIQDHAAKHDRDSVRRIIQRISGHNPYTVYRVRDGHLHILAECGSVTARQFGLAQKFQKQIVWYLTTPPTATGTCRRNHPIRWYVNLYGVWVCHCYFAPELYVSTQLAKRKAVPSLLDYWMQERRE